MAPTSTATELETAEQKLEKLVLDPKPKVALGKAASYIEKLPANTRIRFEKHGIDLSNGYPARSETIPIYVDEAYAIRNEDYPYIERGKNADPEKKALFGAAKEVIDLTPHIGTEIVGLQLADLTDQQKDELALLIAERTVVFFRDQDLPPQKQLELGHYFGQVEVHPQVPFVPGLPGISIIWPDYATGKEGNKATFRQPGGTAAWHTDLVHEHQPAGITHLHLDEMPSVGGDTVWSSGYGAYDKLSDAMKEFLEGKEAVFISAHQYLDRDDPLAGPKFVERTHPIVRTHPATGWKSLYVNRKMTKSIVGLEPGESDLILNYLFDVYEKNLDLQVRFNWGKTSEGKGTSALWDNRISQHFAVYDYEGNEPRHGTRVTALAELPFLDPKSKSRREALGLDV